MGLSEDQKAMLRLLAQREQGYEDIAALMGISVEQVRERVKDALDQLKEETSGSGEPRAAGPVVETGPSSSQAAGEDPISTPPAAAASAEETTRKEQPKAEPPAPAPPTKHAGASPPQISLPESAGARAAIAAGVAALVVLIVVLIVGGGGDSSDSTTAGGSAPSGAEGEPTSANAKKLTKAVLGPVGGSEGTGVAIFGRVNKTALALQVEAEGLEPTGNGRSYAIWLAQSPRKMLPLASTAVGKDGRIGTQFEVPAELLGYLADETFDQIVITETGDAALKASLKKATSEKTAPSYTGTEVLRGKITGPIVGAAKKTE